MHKMLIIFILSGLPFSEQKNNIMVLKPPACNKINRSYYDNFFMSFKDDRLNLDVDIVQPLRSGLRILIDAYTRKSKSVEFTHFYTYSLDVCSLLDKRKRNIFQKWFSTFTAYGNFQDSCPVQPQHYYVKDYQIHDLELPTFFFQGYYLINVTTIQGNGPKKSKDFVISCDVQVQLK